MCSTLKMNLKGQTRIKRQCDAFNFRFESLFVFAHAHTQGLSLMCQVDHLDSHFMKHVYHTPGSMTPECCYVL